MVFSIIVSQKKKPVGHISNRLQNINVTGVMINVQTIRQMNESLTELIRLLLVLVRFLRVPVSFLSK